MRSEHAEVPHRVPGRSARRAPLLALCGALLLSGCATGVEPAQTPTAAPESPVRIESPAGSSSPTASTSPGSSPSTAPESPQPARTLQPGPELDPSAVAEVLDPLLQSWPGELAAVVQDPISGEVLYQHQADTALVPASAVKILTGVAALEVLGADHRYTTSTSLVRTEDGPVVVLDAGGDVLLGAGPSDPEAVVGRAGLLTLAEQTAQELERASPDGTVRVHLADDDFTGPVLEPDWHSSFEGVHVSPVQPIALYSAHVSAADGAARARDPALTAAQTFRQHLAQTAQERGLKLEIAPEIDRGAAPAPALAVDQDVRGLRFRIPYLRLPLGAVESATVGEQVGLMLTESDNQLAEVTGRNLALATGRPGSFSGATDAIQATLTDLGLDTAGLALKDASGLSLQDVAPPRLFAELLILAEEAPQVMGVVQGLPVAGESGTLEGRMAGTAAQGRVSAKTGTLAGVSSLTGTVMTGEGREVVFSILANGQDGTAQDARVMIDEAMVALASCGCTGGQSRQ